MALSFQELAADMMSLEEKMRITVVFHSTGVMKDIYRGELEINDIIQLTAVGCRVFVIDIPNESFTRVELQTSKVNIVDEIKNSAK